MGRYLDLANTALGGNTKGARYEINELNELSLEGQEAPPPADSGPGRVLLLSVPRGVPAPWFEGLRQFLSAPCPGILFQEDWDRLRSDAWGLLRDHGAEASRMGWPALDLFGWHPRAPFARLDCAGMAVILRGRAVVSMDERAARISIQGGSLTFERRNTYPVEAVPLWETEGPADAL